MTKAATRATTAGDREIVATRLFDAPRDLVFSMWTDPTHISEWWGPNGFTTTTHEMGVRPGGVWRHVMHGPDGTDYPNEVVYVEIARPERLVYDHVSDPRFQMTVSFVERGAKTEVTARMRFESGALRDAVATKYGAIEGLGQTLDRLAPVLAALPASGLARRELVITREFDAPRELVFRAWTDPQVLARWWGPKDFTNPVCELDVWPGGAIRIVMRAPDGTEYPMIGEYREIVRPERLVFTSAALDQSGNRILEGFTTVTFIERAGKTTLTVQTSASGVAARVASMLEGMEAGWTQSIDRLAALVATL